MVTTTTAAAPSQFLSRISGPERFPATTTTTTPLFQRLLLLRADYSETCPVGPGGSARPALKRVRRRRGKLRSAPSGLALQSRYQQYQQHRAGLARRTAAASSSSSEPRLEKETEEAPASSPRTAPSAASLGKPLRKELFKNRMAKSEKVTIPYNQPAHGTHLCEQSKTSRQRSKSNVQINKVPSTKKSENNFWQESVSPELIKNQEKKPLKTTENMKLKKPIFLIETSQKENYAGAKFSDPPSPSVLPKPPSHWVGSTAEYSDQNKEMMAVHLKTLLKVQA